MLALSRSDRRPPALRDGGAPAPAGQFGPDAYTDWRATGLGAISEAIERRLILRLAGEVNGCDVLDVGCGDGALALAVWRGGATAVVGCDIDPQMIARATSEAMRHKAAIDYVLAGAENLPFRDQSFDIVTIITVLAFIPKPEVAIREIARRAETGRPAGDWRSREMERVGRLKAHPRLAGPGPDVERGAVQIGRRVTVAG
jgi:2-polyprenyl-3-methyl-5-hydroxy-6-metoxy-1,4-benzoquinol methylase